MTEYISREDVLSKCDDIWNAADETTQTGVDTINTIDEITDFIESLPSADVQPVVHEKWIEHINHRYDYDREQGDIDAGVSYTCSLCNLHGFEGWHFCPNCGARMDGNTNG